MKKILITLIAICSISLMFGQTATENYVKNTIYRTETTTGSVTNDQKIETVTYFDGLGRPMQNVSLRAGGSNEDIITHIGYDAYGRQDKEYLPYSATTTGGSYRIDALNATNTYYDAPKYEADFPGVALNDINAFSQKEFEASPLNRVMKQAAPGKDWKLGNGNEIAFDYQTNTGTEVRYYEVSLTRDVENNVITYIPTLVLDTSPANNNGYYAANALYKSITKDENWTSGTNHTTEEFKDKQGRVVLKRTYGASDINMDGDTLDPGEANATHDTYYVYDKFGNLSYVLPPKAEPSTALPDATELSELCYQYVYDDRNRLVEKKIPGKGWEYIVYDNLDRPIMTQDYITHLIEVGWFCTKYDALGRVAYTGILPHYTVGIGTARTSFQDAANNTNINHVTRVSSPNTTLEGISIYYDFEGYPNGGHGNRIKIHIINYYDDYDFDIGSGTPESSGGITPITNAKGLLTGTKTKVLNMGGFAPTYIDDIITTVNYYDDESNPIYVYSFNEHLSTTNKIKNEFDFTGNIEKTTTTHTKAGQSTITTIDYFTYDPMGRLISQTNNVDGVVSERVVHNNYDALGQLESKFTGNGTEAGYKDISAGIVVSGDEITKTGVNTWNSGLATKGSFTGDGYVEYEMPQIGRLMVGLSSDNSSASYNTIDYALYNYENGYIYVYESGTSKGQFGTYQAGDIFRVERIGSTVYYKQNGEVFYTSAVASSGILLGDVSIHNTSDKIKDLNIVDNSKGLQTVNYAYNVRGWLKQINDVSNLGSDLFGFKINYNTTDHSGTALYNGNISETEWKTANTDNGLKWYKYSYDALNRITSGTNISSNYNLSAVAYDKNGNITSLVRQGVRAMSGSTVTSYGEMDNLTYSYQANSNKLLKVADAATLDQYGFKDDAVNAATDSADDYTYDANGNMEFDYNKNIYVMHNHLNLPSFVYDLATGATIHYIYDANGIKLKKIVSTGTTTEYAGNYVYEDTGTGSSLKFFNHAEGYVDTSSGYEYVYQYKDHLGNIRLSYKDNNSVTLDNDTFDSGTGGWQGQSATLVNENQKLKVTASNQWNGVEKYYDVTVGDKINYQLLLDKATTEKLVLVIYEHDNSYVKLKTTVIESDANGFISGSYDVTTGSKIRIKVEKGLAGDNGTSTYFYLDNVLVVNSKIEILEENNYYPFGGKHKGYNTNVTSTNIALKRKFGGKEYQDELDLNWYDVTARNYDPYLGRWMNIDPLAEKMRRYSPYAYAFDNPIYWIDYDGMSPSGCCNDNDPPGDEDDYETPLQELYSNGDFTPSEETANLLSEGMDLLANAFELKASVKGKIGVGGGIKAFGTDIKGEANIISVTGEVVPGADKTTVNGKLRVVDIRGSIKVGPKDSDAAANIWGSFNVADINVSADTDLNIDGSIENGGFDGDVNLGVGDSFNLKPEDVLEFGATGKIGPAKVSGSVNLYNLGKGLAKTVEGGLNYFSEYVSDLVTWDF